MCKISLEEAITALDESVVEDICWSDRNSVDVSAYAIKKRVSKKIPIKKQRVFVSIKTVIVVCCLIAIVLPCYAVMNMFLDKSSVVDDKNKNLIGTEIKSDYYIILDENGVYSDAYGNTGTLEDIINKNNKNKGMSRIVKATEVASMTPSSYVEIPFEKRNGDMYIYPEIIMVNNSACILTAKNGKGWALNKGDSLTYRYKKAKAENIDKQTMIIGYIQDNILKSGEVRRDIEGTYTFTAREKGIYYIYLISGSSDYQTVIEESLEVN